MRLDLLSNIQLQFGNRHDVRRPLVFQPNYAQKRHRSGTGQPQDIVSNPIKSSDLIKRFITIPITGLLTGGLNPSVVSDSVTHKMGFVRENHPDKRFRPNGIFSLKSGGVRRILYSFKAASRHKSINHEKTVDIDGPTFHKIREEFTSTNRSSTAESLVHSFHRSLENLILRI